MKKRLVIILLAVVTLVALIPVVALADNSGWKSATGYNDNTNVGSPGNAYVSDDNYANFDFHADSVHFTFGNDIVPSTAIIQGIQVQMEARESLVGGRSFEVTLLDSGTERGVNTTGALTDEDAIYTLGGTSDTWGYGGWTADKINNYLEVKVRSRWGTFNAYLDQILLRVTYSLPTTTTMVTSSDNTSTYGQSVTFTATVNPGAATGTVVFKANGSTIGSAAISGGSASITTSSLPAGSYTITAAYGGSTLYQASSGTLAGGQTVSKANATIHVSGANVPYDGTAHGATGTATGADGSNLNSLLNLGATYTNVPGGTANWTFAGDANHNADSGSVNIVINKANAAIHVNGAIVPYDGAAHGATGSATGADGSNLTSLLDFGESYTNVPGGIAHWIFTGDANHNAANGSVGIVINKADANIDVDGATVPYDGAAHGATGTATGADGSDLTALLDLGSSFTNVPGGTAYWTFAGDTNHNAASGSVDILINKADADIDVDGATVPYDGAAHGATGTATGADGSDLTSLLDLGSSFTNVPGGTADWTFAGDANHNAASGSVDILINKADADIDVDGATVPYDGAAHGATGTATGADGSDLTSLLDLGSSFTHVPGGTAYWTFAGDANHNAASGSVDIVINKATLAVTADNLSIIYGDAKPPYTYKIGAYDPSIWDGIVTGMPALNCTYSTGSKAGSYAITVDVSPMTAQDYAFIPIDGTLTVNTKILDVYNDDFVITYGAARPDFTARFNGFVNGDDEKDLAGTLLFDCTYTVGKPVTTYGIGSYGLENPNYQIVFHNGLLTVNKAPLTVAADNKTVTYLDPAPIYTAQYSGFVAGDDKNDLGGTLALGCTYAAGSAAGTYDITPSGLTSDNYDITFTKGALTVNQLVLTVTFKDYDGDILDTQQVIYGNAATAPTNPTRTGYRFTGWDSDFSAVKNNLTVTAQYTIRTYTVSFVDFDGTLIDTQTVRWNGGATAPADPVREGYTFTGWDTSFDPVTSSLTVTAQYSINTYTVTFADYDGTVLSTQTVDWNTAATAPADPSRDGFTFTGWDSAFDAVKADTTVMAQYEEITSIDDEDIPDTGNTIPDEPVPAAAGGTFAWWWIPIIVGAAAILFFLIFFVVRRKKKQEENA